MKIIVLTKANSNNNHITLYSFQTTVKPIYLKNTPF